MLERAFESLILCSHFTATLLATPQRLAAVRIGAAILVLLLDRLGTGRPAARS
jgi:hypothetical protein